MKRSQDFKAEDGLRVTVTSPNPTKEVRSEVRLRGQMIIYLLAGLYKTQNQGVSIIQIEPNYLNHPIYKRKNSNFYKYHNYFNHTLFVNEIRPMYVPMCKYTLISILKYRIVR